MKILALDLSSARGSIAFRDGTTDSFAAEFANDRKHSGMFFENLQRCVRQCGHAERIVVGLGPGSYAGSRIAIAAAIGLQAISPGELGGVASILAMPTNAREYLVVGDARRQSFFFAHVVDRRCVDGPQLCTAAELEVRLAAAHQPVFSTESLRHIATTVSYPSASLLAELAADRPSAMTLPPLQPIYLREPHITYPKVARQ
ncbi:MAG: tRNA (adenosine(37)-N6)-threonylcarbamoyltransferase complex dimerization subunit type 1 TsaB [Verrucomicrobiota bacterium]|nr:tRNA (adenosine(37)-N6)-threonylcarbamoyltransferase complex dimerization subunit type 1 TsaB [Verrucomicrobiota bacterium]